MNCRAVCSRGVHADRVVAFFRENLGRAFARRVFALYYGVGLETASAESVAALAPEFGFQTADMLRARGDPELKDRVKRVGEEAVGRGVFGSPFFIVDDEPFWGWDRMPMLEDWIRKGGQ